jgi:transposase
MRSGHELAGNTYYPRVDTGWQAHQAEGSFAGENFVVVWERQQATRPGGKTNQTWQPSRDTRGNDSIHIRFSKKDCGSCPLLPCIMASSHHLLVLVQPP